MINFITNKVQSVEAMEKAVDIIFVYRRRVPPDVKIYWLQKKGLLGCNIEAEGEELIYDNPNIYDVFTVIIRCAKLALGIPMEKSLNDEEELLVVDWINRNLDIEAVKR